MSEEPKRYEIRTLSDIYRLPTIDAMDRCLRELAEIMVSTRALAEIVAGTARNLAEKDGVKIPEGPLHVWPETSTWVDDGGLAGTEVSFDSSGGEELMRMSITKADPSKP